MSSFVVLRRFRQHTCIAVGPFHSPEDAQGWGEENDSPNRVWVVVDQIAANSGGTHILLPIYKPHEAEFDSREDGGGTQPNAR